MGAWLDRQRPGVQEIRINYGSGQHYNTQPCRFARRGLPPRQIRLHQHDGLLVLDLPTAQEAIVPHRSEVWPTAPHHNLTAAVDRRARRIILCAGRGSERALTG